MMNFNERYSRQKSLVPEKIKDTTVTIVGTGAIGRNVAIQLASMGCESMILYDFDKVEESNVASQGFLESQIGMDKVLAVQESCLKINQGIKFIVSNKEFVKSSMVSEVVFSCVDKMNAREIIAKSVERRKDSVGMFIDGRMAGETARILAFDPKKEIEVEAYLKTIVSDENAYQGSCTAKSTIYCSNIISGFMISTYAKYLRENDYDNDFMINIAANELFLTGE